MEISIECTSKIAEAPGICLRALITQSDYRLPHLRQAFTEALGTIKFCKVISIETAQKKRGNYELYATLRHPFKFPEATFTKNFRWALDGVLFKTIRAQCTTREKAECFNHNIQWFFKTMDVQPIILLADNTIAVKYTAKRADHKKIKKYIKRLSERLNKYTEWVVDAEADDTTRTTYAPYDVLAIASLIQLTGFTGKIVTRDGYKMMRGDDAGKYTNAYQTLKADWLSHKKNSVFIVGSQWLVNQSWFLVKYDAQVRDHSQNIYWIVMKYNWYNCFNGGKQTTVRSRYDLINQWVIAALEATKSWVKFFSYKTETREDALKLIYFMEGHEATLANNRVSGMCKIPSPRTLEEIVAKFHANKNSISIMPDDIYGSDFDRTIITKAFKHHLKQFKLDLVLYQEDGRKQFVVAKCGPMILRRIMGRIHCLYEAYKQDYLKGRDATREEILSLDTLDETSAFKIPYIMELDSQLYNVQELFKHFHESGFTIPHNRRELTPEEIDRVFEIADAGNGKA